ncbi:putative disease resistance RPP13-like protein 3 [Bienertia sinuspersici]
MPQADDLDKQETNKLKNMLRIHLLTKKYIIFWMMCGKQVCGMRSKLGSLTNIMGVGFSSPPAILMWLDMLVLRSPIFFGVSGDLCPSHLQTLGMEIVDRCKGLPLSVVVIASMLASQEKSERIWERTLKDVSVHLSKDEACLEILALSYHYLPIELKPCFLYFAAFPEDYEMSVQRLIALWLAKGFIHPLGELTMEEVAESYLDALIDRSLVQSGNKRTDGGLKTCRIHDLIRDLCIREAKCDNFMWATSKINGSCSTIRKSKPRRLSIHRYTTRTILSKDCVSSSVRAILSFESQKTFASTTFWKKVYTEYKLLRVLDLGAAIRVDTLPKDIDNLANLRYLRLFLNAIQIPESIYDLRNLQMLFMEGIKSLNVPIKALLKLKSLQQLILGKSITRIYGNSKVSLPQIQLESLQVLSSIYPDSDFECAIMNGLCPNLKKLSLYSSHVNIWSLKNFFASLPNLQSLKMSFSDSNVSCDIFREVSEAKLPSNLTKVTLKSSYWSDDSLNMLGKFSNLRILKLQDMKNISFKVRKGSFPRLHTLHLDNIQGGIIECSCRFGWSGDIFTLPSLKDIQFLWPNGRLADSLERSK